MDNSPVNSGASGLLTPKATFNVLIVDESTTHIQYLHQILQNHFNTHFATDDKQAKQMANELQPDIVVMAINNHSFDSIMLCRQFVSPVVFLTDVLVVEQMIKGIESGAIEVLTTPTPVNAEEFVLRIEAQIILGQARKSKSIALETVAGNQSTITNLNEIPDKRSEENVEKQKVLIVDDSISNIQVLNEILAEDHEIFFATNGKQAIAMALEERPDLIILDVVMPLMDGYKVCEKLKSIQETKDIGIIFVTALNEVQDEAKGLEMGAIDYIVKPFSSHIVRARMHNHMELIKHRKMLSSLSMTDGLTGIANRRQFDQILHRELYRAIRNKESLTLILIDIDNFKKYNDHYGHVTGDECLKKVAMAIESCRVRMTDFVARYGGEEFAVVLPNTDREGAQYMANKILVAIFNLAVEHIINNNDFGVVTASSGVYCCVPDHQTTADSAIKEADEGLYKAKYLGRNQTVFVHDY